MIKIKHVADSQICVIDPITDRLTAANATSFKDEVWQLIDKGEYRLVIDLTGVAFVDSSAIGALVGILKRLGNRGEIVVCGLSGSVDKMFRITRMDRVFPTYPNSAEAAAALSERL
ncbi:STAS domain-containing protein [Paracoccus sp. JM45]|uniref:STAS domain-containing protein n=1 Tax=Paracoccus sp. JM45 TaxID=2283626 RepID=UPI000E6D088F|nr:STAS domain-containing protein [Paracoccus sp. JM45]RJE78720.1 anti-sigma factor antagonist [Paracoccus sp. JM45]